MIRDMRPMEVKVCNPEPGMPHFIDLTSTPTEAEFLGLCQTIGVANMAMRNARLTGAPPPSLGDFLVRKLSAASCDTEANK